VIDHLLHVVVPGTPENTALIAVMNTAPLRSLRILLVAWRARRE